MDKDPPIENLGKNPFWPLNQPLSWEDIDSFPDDLKISDRLDLASNIADWSRVFRGNVKGHRQAPSPAQQRATFKKLGPKLDKAVEAITDLRLALRSGLLNITSDDLPRLDQSEIQDLVRRRLLIQIPGILDFYTIEIDPIIDVVEILHARVGTLNNAFDKAKNEGQTVNPTKRMDMRLVIEQIEKYWRVKTSRGFHAEFGTSSPHYVGYAPLNDPSRFAYEVIQRIDRFANPSLVERAMKDKL